MSAVVCPDCGRVLFLIAGTPGDEEPGSWGAGEPARGRDGEDASPREERPPGEGIRCTFREDKWRLECPRHGWHGAKQWPSKDGKPAAVKCTAQLENGNYCDVRVPLEQARRSAGVRS